MMVLMAFRGSVLSRHRWHGRQNMAYRRHLHSRRLLPGHLFSMPGLGEVQILLAHGCGDQRSWKGGGKDELHVHHYYYYYCLQLRGK